MFRDRYSLPFEVVDLHDSQSVVNVTSRIDIGGQRAIYRHAEHVFLLGNDHVTVLATEIRELLSKNTIIGSLFLFKFETSGNFAPFLSRDMYMYNKVAIILIAFFVCQNVVSPSCLWTYYVLQRFLSCLCKDVLTTSLSKKLLLANVLTVEVRASS